MQLEQIYTGCLSHGAYYIESNGEAVVIDPLREVAPYMQRADRDGAKIKYVLETHFHADFVSGHLDLAAKTGAQIVFGPTAKPGFDACVASDGAVLKVGDITFTVLHTPGHTLESTCYLLKNEAAKEIAIFTGDTLFIGDVGRPDLAQKLSTDLTPEKLAEYLFDSLRNKIMPLANDLVVYPAHGAGSACGKNMSKETTDTLGNQKMFNYALRADMSKEEFVKEVTAGLLPPPAYFPGNVLMNIGGYDSIDMVLERGRRGLDSESFETAANETGAVMLDTRDAHAFAKGFVPNSINIGINGSFAPWVGALLPDIQQKILLITEGGRAEEAVTRLARVGYDHTVGFLEGGMEAWIRSGKEIEQIESISAGHMAEMMLNDSSVTVLDVRKPAEFYSEHVSEAENIPLDYINDHLARIDKDKKYLVYCAGGYRSMMFCSILKARGYDNLVDVSGGFKAIKDSGKITLSSNVCATTML